MSHELADNQTQLVEKARQIRIDILQAVHSAGKGHIGGAYSIVEILVSLYHGNTLKCNLKYSNLK